MRVRNMDGIKISSPKYISNVVTTGQKAEPQNTMPEKDMCDDVNISEKGKALLAADRELLEKFRQQRLFDTFGDMKDIKEIPEEYKRENLFKIKLEADSIFGGVNLFQENLTRQYEGWFSEYD